MMAVVSISAFGFPAESVVPLPVSPLGGSAAGNMPGGNLLFFVPPMAWNAALGRQIPMGYFSGIAPLWVVIAENVFRTASMAYAFFLPINTQHDLFLPGLGVYAAGMFSYFASWLVLSYLPDSAAAQSPLPRLAPAYLPLVWLGGMSMMAVSPLLMLLSTLFVGFHVTDYALRYDW